MTGDDSDIVGAREIAERLGVKRETVNMWMHRALLPKPAGRASGVPVWRWPDVEDWARDTKRLDDREVS